MWLQSHGNHMMYHNNRNRYIYTHNFAHGYCCIYHVLSRPFAILIDCKKNHMLFITGKSHDYLSRDIIHTLYITPKIWNLHLVNVIGLSSYMYLHISKHLYIIRLPKISPYKPTFKNPSTIMWLKSHGNHMMYHNNRNRYIYTHNFALDIAVSIMLWADPLPFWLIVKKFRQIIMITYHVA